MNLNLPTFIDESSTGVSPQPRKVKQWLSDLPMVNMGDATRLLYETLRSFNRQSIPAKTRLEIMEMIRPYARQALDHLNKNFFTCAFPLMGKSRQVEQLAQTLLEEMAFGYKQIVSEVDAHNIRFEKRSLNIATHRGMRYLEKSLHLSAKLYINPPASLWRDLHQLFEFSEVRGVTDQIVADDEYKTIKESTVSDVYKQCCLLALTEPTHLRSGGAEKLIRIFEQASKFCKITKSLIPDENGSLYVASLRSSEPPVYVTLGELTAFNNLRGFDLNELIELTRSALNTEDHRPLLFHEIDDQWLEEILATWTTHKKRFFKRAPASCEIIAVTGIKNIANAISNDAFPELSTTEILSKQAKKNAVFTEASISPWNTTSERETLVSHSDPDPTIETAKTPKLPDTWQHWKLLNTSAGGYGMLWDNPSPSSAQVGEIIAIREKEQSQYQWRLCQIRWMKHTSQGALSIGVQLIAPRAIVALIEDMPSRGLNQTSGHIIMLPGMKSKNQKPSILVRDALKPGDELELSLFGKQVYVKLTKLGQQHSFYKQFFYESMGLPSREEETND